MWDRKSYTINISSLVGAGFIGNHLVDILMKNGN